MIPRYSMPEMAAVFADETRLGLWLEIELLAVEAWSKLGVVPPAHAKACRARAPEIDAVFLRRVAEREAVTDHDVAAFVDVVQESIGGTEGSWIHYGLTSSDVVDTALSATLVRAADLLLAAASRLGLGHESAGPSSSRRCRPSGERTACTPSRRLSGPSSLWPACRPTVTGRAFRRAREAVRVGKLSGAVGTYSNIAPFGRAVRVRCSRACNLFRPHRSSPGTAMPSTCTRVPRSARTIESLATEIRHLQRTEVGEVEEPFSAAQKGSSAMPHKRNPITAERLAGLARVLRGYLVAGLEDVALWHERDISHSSVERIVLPDASMVAYYATTKMSHLIDGLVDPRRPHA